MKKTFFTTIRHSKGFQKTNISINKE